MKYIADVNVSRRVVESLRALGFDIIRVTELLDARSSDQTILSEAARLHAVLISHDHFGALLAITGATSPSFVNLRLSEVDATRLAASIEQVLRATHEELSSGAVVTLDDNGVRVHLLPLA